MKKTILGILMLILLIHAVSASIIRGTVYNPALEPLENTVLKINSTPAQQYLAKDGTYTFEVPKGRYRLSATSADKQVAYSTEEELEVTEEGEYIIDLFLFPSLENDIALYPDLSTEENGFELPQDQINYKTFLAAGLLILGIIILLTFWYKNKTIEPKKSEEDVDDEYTAVFHLIEKQKRITQKEIRKLVPFSEAKISLILTEMEEKGIIQKIKKGRGNIILLQKE